MNSKAVRWTLFGGLVFLTFMGLAIIGALTEDDMPASAGMPTPTASDTPTPTPTPTVSDTPTPAATATPTPAVTTSESQTGCPQFIMSGREFTSMNRTEYEQRLRDEGCSEEGIAQLLATFETDQAELRRWQEAAQHWEYVDAFTDTMMAVNADKVIDLQESRNLCYKAPQWRAEMTAVIEYVSAYREVEPAIVSETPRIYKLEIEANRLLEIVAELEKECR